MSHKCKQCQKRFSQKCNLNTHALVHTGVKPHQCEHCERRFNHISNLNTHILVHTGEKPHKCKQCGRRFSQKGHLYQHMLVHTGEKPYQCKQCKKKFSQKGGLNKHLLVHTREKPHQCKQCGARFRQKSHLTGHVLVHTGEKPYQCKQCEKGFSQKGSLATHILVHTGEKPHQCKQCEKRFNLKANLNIHMLAHTGEKPYKCKQCDKRFSQKSNLTTHTLVHTGEKPHQCKQCKKRFSQKGGLNKHLLVHTGEKQVDEVLKIKKGIHSKSKQCRRIYESGVTSLSSSSGVGASSMVGPSLSEPTSLVDGRSPTSSMAIPMRSTLTTLQLPRTPKFRAVKKKIHSSVSITAKRPKKPAQLQPQMDMSQQRIFHLLENLPVGDSIYHSCMAFNHRIRSIANLAIQRNVLDVIQNALSIAETNRFVLVTPTYTDPLPLVSLATGSQAVGPQAPEPH